MTTEDEPEQLDWGNEDDEQMASELRAHKGMDSRVDAEDAEDAISLGSQEGDNDDYYVYQTRPQQDASRGLSTPKSTSFAQQFSHQSTRELQRENSTTSQKQLSHSQDSPQQSPHRSSFSKITHALPPKPVVSNVPFLHLSHPSIIEATAMARGRSDRDKKTNGSASTKPISIGDVGEPLPPDWEARQPRSGGRGIYYYNTRTHHSTWTHPAHISSSQDKETGRALPSESRPAGKHGFDGVTSVKSTEQSRRPETDPHVSSVELTYADRHYRPGADLKPNMDSSKRDERPSRVSSGGLDTFTPSTSPKPDRPSSPLQQTRDLDRLKRPSHQSPHRHSPDGRGSLRVTIRDNVPSDVERHWGQSRERQLERQPPSENASHRRTTPSHTRQQDRDVDLSSTSPAFEDQNSHSNDAVWSSTPSTLSASSSHLSTSRDRRHCSSHGGGRDIPASCEALGVELRRSLYHSPLLGLFPESTQGRSSWIHLFFPFSHFLLPYFRTLSFLCTFSIPCFRT